MLDPTVPEEPKAARRVNGNASSLDRARDPNVPYAELTDAEKLERHHYVIGLIDQRLAYLQSVVDQLTRHQHGADGRLLVEMRILPPPTSKDSSGWF